MVWGGTLGAGFQSAAGGIYDPDANRWNLISSLNAPEARSGHTAVWTGTEMLVWGGLTDQGDCLNTGGRFDYIRNIWSPTSTNGAPSPRTGHTVVYDVGRTPKMLIWGGECGGALTNSGALYTPRDNADSKPDNWVDMSTFGAPSSRTGHTAVWTGTKMIIWGGKDWNNSSTNTGGIYDYASDTWTPITTFGAPSPRTHHTAVWNGSRMVVWGGQSDNGTKLATGAQYDPKTDKWSMTHSEE